jgi:hypothetical protein
MGRLDVSFLSRGTAWWGSPQTGLAGVACLPGGKALNQNKSTHLDNRSFLMKVIRT